MGEVDLLPKCCITVIRSRREVDGEDALICLAIMLYYVIDLVGVARVLLREHKDREGIEV